MIKLIMKVVKQDYELGNYHSVMKY